MDAPRCGAGNPPAADEILDNTEREQGLVKWYWDIKIKINFICTMGIDIRQLYGSIYIPAVNLWVYKIIQQACSDSVKEKLPEKSRSTPKWSEWR